MTGRTTAPSPRFKARLAAALYLISAAPAGFSVYVLLKLVVRGDPAATAANILASEARFRLGLAADLIGILLVVGSVLLLYELFKPVSGSLARIVTSSVLIGSAVQALDAITDLAALIVLKGGNSLAAFNTAQAQAMAFLFLRLHTLVYDLALVFYGAGFILLGTLILRSTFLPRVLGVLVAIDGLGYMTFSFATFLSPPFVSHLYPYLPFLTAALGEGSLMLWLLVKGVDGQRWEEQAAVGDRVTARSGNELIPRGQV